MSLRVWRNATSLDIYRDIGFPGRPPQLVVFIPSDYGPGADFFPSPLDLDGFTTGPSDYDMSSDEAYCPCGDTLSGWDGTAAHLLRLIYQHCESKGHPQPVFEP